MFIIKCTECGKEWEIKTYEDISGSPIYPAGYDGEIGIACDCGQKHTEG